MPEMIWMHTQGQPWLVNALADEACFAGEFAEAWHRPVTADSIHTAREQLILRRETHLDRWPTSCKRSGCGGWSSRC